MGTDIGALSDAVKASGAAELIKQINTIVIDKGAKQLEAHCNTLCTGLDPIWVGPSADNFKANMKSDVGKIVEALTTTKNAIENEINAAMQKIMEAEEKLVNKYGE
ncbi:hypothetical protein IKE98_00805 [Candidatus Saccharibacteria bacterium]|nr:hypothetical protein [Candidatus Saccharibacteria bacterium]